MQTILDVQNKHKLTHFLSHNALSFDKVSLTHNQTQEHSLTDSMSVGLGHCPVFRTTYRQRPICHPKLAQNFSIFPKTLPNTQSYIYIFIDNFLPRIRTPNGQSTQLYRNLHTKRAPFRTYTHMIYNSLNVAVCNLWNCNLK